MIAACTEAAIESPLFKQNSPMFILRLQALKFLWLLLFVPALAWGQAPVRIAMVEGLSGPFANTGEAVYRNLLWAVERVNQRGGVQVPAAAGGNRPLRLDRYDSKGQNEEALSALRSAIDDGAQIVVQGNSSANAAALLDAKRKPGHKCLGPVIDSSSVTPDPVPTIGSCPSTTPMHRPCWPT